MAKTKAKEEKKTTNEKPVSLDPLTFKMALKVLPSTLPVKETGKEKEEEPI